MYFYTHVISTATISFSETFTGGTTYDAPATENASSSLYEVTSRGLVSKSFSAGASFDGVAGSSDVGYSYTSYVFGTMERSVSYISGTTATQNGTDPEESGTISIYPAGSSTGIDSITYTALSSVTKTFSQTFATFSTSSLNGTSTSYGVSTLSGTASATSQATDLTATFTLSSATTLVPFFALSMPTVQRWYVDRQNPFNTDKLRAVGVAVAITHNSGTGAAQSLSAGANIYAQDLSFSSKQTSSTFGTTVSGLDEYRETQRAYMTGGGVEVTYWSAVGILDAKRRAISGQAFVYDNSLYGELSFDSTISASWTGGVPVALGINSLSIFTTQKIFDSTTFQWKYESSSWFLHASSSNSSTSTTYTIGINPNLSVSTDSSGAIEIIGCTTALLGPIYPFTVENLNEISVSTLRADSTGVSHYFSYTGQTYTSSLSSTPTTINASSTTTTSFSSSGSKTGFCPIKFGNSLLTCAVANIIASVSSSSWESYYEGEGSIPSIYPASKWNEAGRSSPVSVIQ